MKKSEIMDYYTNKVVICNHAGDWDVSIFTNQNVSGYYGVGLRGRYFTSELDFIQSISLTGRTKLYTLENINLSGLTPEELTLNIVKSRSEYCSDNPTKSRELGLMVEIEDFYKMLKET